MKIAIPDLISNSYFPVIAAVELGCFREEGLDVDLELVVPVENALAALKDGSLEFLGCSSHLVVGGFPEWQGAKLLCAQSQGMYWFLVMRSDLEGRARRSQRAERSPHRRGLLGRHGAEAASSRARNRSGARWHRDRARSPGRMAPA